MKRFSLVIVAALVLTATAVAAITTDVSNLGNLANAITTSNNSTNIGRIKTYAQAQAAATQSQEAAIEDLQSRVAALETPPPPATGDTTPPSVPGNLRVTASSDTGITIGWDPATDNTGVTNYRIYRDGTMIGQGAGSSGGFADTWADSGLACGKSYQYAVEAQDAAGNTGPKASISASTAACSPPPPPPATTISGAECSSRAQVAGAVIENVTVNGDCDITAQNVTIRNTILTGAVKFTPSASGGKLLNSSAQGFYIFGADNVTLDDNVLDARGTDNINIIWDEPAGNRPDNFVIRNNHIMNVYSSTDPTSHNEGIYVGYSAGGLIEGNTFTNNGNSAQLFFTNFGNQFNDSSYPRNICVRGNTFQETHGAYFDINFGGNVTTVGPATTQIRIDPNNVMPHGITNPEFIATC